MSTALQQRLSTSPRRPCGRPVTVVVGWLWHRPERDRSPSRRCVPILAGTRAILGMGRGSGAVLVRQATQSNQGRAHRRVDGRVRLGAEESNQFAVVEADRRLPEITQLKHFPEYGDERAGRVG